MLAVVRIERVERPGADWDAFAEGLPGAHLGHAGAWAGVLEAAYRLRPCYLACQDGEGTRVGVLPLVEMRTLQGRRELVSIPFHDVAGVLASSTECRRALVEEALAFARERGCTALDLRQAAAIPELPPPTGAGPAARVNLVLPLASDEATQWDAIGAKV